MTAFTVECHDCDFITDLDDFSETNPQHCPECDGQLYYEGTEERYPDADDYEPDLNAPNERERLEMMARIQRLK